MTGAGWRSDRPHGVSPRSKTWPYVLAFAVEMERKLAENAYKDEEDGEPGWLHGFHPHEAIARIWEEMIELRDANAKVYTFPFQPTQADRQSVTDEAADVGNMSMMLACITGTLKPYAALASEARRAGEGGVDEQRR